MVDELDKKEYNMTSPSKDLSDAERKVTLAISGLSEMLFMISNHLGSPVSPMDAENVKVNKPKPKKIPVGEGTMETDNSSLGNRAVPRHAGTPAKPITISKPSLKKSRDFTGRSISRDDPEIEEVVEENQAQFEDKEKLLPMVGKLVAGAVDDKEEKALLPQQQKAMKLLDGIKDSIETMLDELKDLDRQHSIQGKQAMMPDDRRLNQ
jgi:hypothetical protein